MKAERYVRFWAFEALRWLVISVVSSLCFTVLRGLGVNSYFRGMGAAAAFIVHLGVVGAFCMIIALLMGFQQTVPLLVSMNVTRRAAVWGLVAAHSVTALGHVLLGIVIWCVFGVIDGELLVFLASLLAVILFGFGSFGALLGAVVLRWGKIGTLFLVLAITVGSGALGFMAAMQNDVFLHLQRLTMDKFLEYNFWPLALAMVGLYLLVGIFAAAAAKKIEVRV